MKAFTQGREAEGLVASHLAKHGFIIVAQNWRRPRCEIDLVTTKKDVVYFVEVKFRGSDAQGDGFEYITPRKLKQMNLAASFWLAESGLDCDWRLMAASVSNNGKVDLVEI